MSLITSKLTPSKDEKKRIMVYDGDYDFVTGNTLQHYILH